MAKRSCDFCVRRKTKCDGGVPCRKCVEARPRLECTYFKPVLKRGPKSSKLWQRQIGRQGPTIPKLSSPNSGEGSPDLHKPEVGLVYGQARMGHLPASLLTSIIQTYCTRMYPVWPVVDAPRLQARLEDIEKKNEPDQEAYSLATALCAATMAQLNLAPVLRGPCNVEVDSAYMETECQRTRNLMSYREHPTIEGALTSFFLHVYHAKADHRNSAMMFLQEAIALARLLHMDDMNADTYQLEGASLENQDRKAKLLFLLLWVSERYGP